MTEFLFFTQKLLFFPQGFFSFAKKRKAVVDEFIKGTRER